MRIVRRLAAVAALALLAIVIIRDLRPPDGHA
jgi:hypothetical protein